jgi:hypothetical protein
VEVAAMEHDHCEMPVAAAELLEVGGVENFAFLVEEIEPVDRLRVGHDRIVEAERAKSAKRIGAEAEPRAERLELICLFVDIHVPADETQPLRGRQSGNACPDDRCAHLPDSSHRQSKTRTVQAIRGSRRI